MFSAKIYFYPKTFIRTSREVFENIFVLKNIKLKIVQIKNSLLVQNLWPIKVSFKRKKK
jgi:hypothetical protein